MTKQSKLLDAEVVTKINEPEQAIAPRDDVLGLMEMALKNDASVETLEKLVAMKYEHERRESVKEFNAALNKAKASFPKLTHNRRANVVSKSGSKYGYSYCDLPYLDRTLGPILHKYGFRYRWDTDPAEDGYETVVFILSHVGGHEERSRFRSKVGSLSKVSATQEIEMANTTAKRRSMTQGLGITDDAEDNDTAPTAGPPPEPIKPSEADALQAKIKKVAGTDQKKWTDRMLAAYGCREVEDLTHAQYVEAMKKLERK